jgi:hydrogenase maturation protease
MNAAFGNNSAPSSGKLVIGIGNEFRGDDGVGLFVARQLQKITDLGAAVLETSGEGTELMRLWSGAKFVIAIDAVHSGAEPGRIFRFALPEDDIPRAIFPRHSTHAFGILEAIELAKTLSSLPSRIIVYGIEGKSYETGAAISDEVIRAASELIAKVAGEIAQTATRQRNGA